MWTCEFVFGLVSSYLDGCDKEKRKKEKKNLVRFGLVWLRWFWQGRWFGLVCLTLVWSRRMGQTEKKEKKNKKKHDDILSCCATKKTVCLS